MNTLEKLKKLFNSDYLDSKERKELYLLLKIISEYIDGKTLWIYDEMLSEKLPDLNHNLLIEFVDALKEKNVVVIDYYIYCKNCASFLTSIKQNEIDNKFISCINCGKDINIDESQVRTMIVFKSNLEEIQKTKNEK